jgi:putative DNA primase/helicase
VNTRQEFEEQMAEKYPDWTPWQEPIYRHDDDNLVLSDGDKAGFGVVELVNAPVSNETVERVKRILQGGAGGPEFKPMGTVNDSEPSPTTGTALATQPTIEVMPPDCGEMEVGDYYDNITCTDLANGKRLARFCGNDLCYVVDRKAWFVWDGKRWAEDTGNVRVMRCSKEIAKAIFSEADTYDEEKAKKVRMWAWKSCSKPRLEAMVKLAQSEGTVARRMREFDTEEHLLNCENGIIDLRTGELLPHGRARMMMNICPVGYDPKAECPTWYKFLARVQRDDAEMISFLQRVAGYCLWGSSREEALMFLHGKGRNGKGKFLHALLEILGTYGTTVPFATFLEGTRFNAGGTNEAIAGMAGKRLVVAQESKPTGRFNESLLKTLTGGDRQSASFKYGHNFEFDPKFTLLLAANDKPRIIDQSEAIKSRIRLVPFTVFIPEVERDLLLSEKLKSEYPGILAWCVRGAVEWNNGGLRIPEGVRAASREYFSDQDSIGQWLAECAEEGCNLTSRASFAYDSYKMFSEENNFFVIDARQFKEELSSRGYQHGKDRKGKFWRGFKVTSLGTQYEEDPNLPEDVVS